MGIVDILMRNGPLSKHRHRFSATSTDSFSVSRMGSFASLDKALPAKRQPITVSLNPFNADGGIEREVGGGGEQTR